MISTLSVVLCAIYLWLWKLPSLFLATPQVCVCVCVCTYTCVYVCVMHCCYRNGVVRHESVMKLGMKIEELGKMKGILKVEKGVLYFKYVPGFHFDYICMFSFQILWNF